LNVPYWAFVPGFEESMASRLEAELEVPTFAGRVDNREQFNEAEREDHKEARREANW
jgi:hypothetical protein